MPLPPKLSPTPHQPESAVSGQKTSFELAAERARARFPDQVWALLEPGQRSQAIYEELRLIDAENARATRRHT